jgi:hypothetical protein
VAIVAALGLGLLALVLWKHYSADPEPVVTAPTSKPTVAPPPPKEDDVPPPPPVEDSGPETGPPKSTGGTPSNWASCDLKVCPGKANGDLESALAFRAKTAHKCYDEALSQDSTLKGSVRISVRIAANGNLCAANVASSDLGNPSVATCIANRFRQAGHFPTPTGGCVDVEVPISLMPAH